MNRPAAPSPSYKKLQNQLRELSETGRGPERRTTLEKKLEREFMVAWGLTKDRLRLSYKLEGRLSLLNHRGGLDHCKHYTGDCDQRVIVTQPYGDVATQLKADFTLYNGVCPEVIEASEWGYYFPGHASLVILIFPADYAKSLDVHLRNKQELELAELRDAVVTEA